MAAPQFRKLQLDDPIIAKGYSEIIHKLFTNHNIYKRVQIKAERGKREDWTIEDENLYEAVGREITMSMLSAGKNVKCTQVRGHRPLA
jgi:hypothetical protein